MKKNFMIAVNKDNAEAYKKTLIALGYELHEYEKRQNYYGSCLSIKFETYYEKFWFSEAVPLLVRPCHFRNIEEFLIWHFTPEKTQAEIELEKLQEQIVSLQNQAEKLKASL